MVDPDSSRLWKNGLFIALGLTVLGLFVLMIGSSSQLLSKKTGFITRFPNASGLKKGDTVNYLGVQVGYVDSFDIGGGKNQVEIHFKVDAKVGKKFTTTHRAKIAMLGILGDKYIEVVPGRKPGEPLDAGAEIPSDESFDLSQAGERAQDLIGELKGVSVKLNTALESLNTGEGTIPRLYNDPEYGRKILGDLEGSMDSLRTVLAKLNAGKGAVPRLLNDPVLGDRLVGNLDATAKQLNTIASRIETGPGALHTVMADDKFNAEMKDLLHDLKETAAALHQQNSALGRLLNDPKYGEELTSHLSSSVRHLDSILTKIDNGEGTLGAIINDRAVYDDLRDLSAGLNKSGLAKKAIKHYEKKGHEKREKAASAPGPAPEAESAPAGGSAPATVEDVPPPAG
jgi:phospholipid/cholesterol/gamma-HCH transport system substrate-binding protein